MSKALVSVIIPTAKRSCDFVMRAISSALNQTYSPLEILVVDDNVDGNLSTTIENYLKGISNVRYIKNIGIHGAGAARNVGIACATGDVIAFLDDDDEWLPEKTAIQMNALTQDVVYVYSNGWKIDTRCENTLQAPYREEKDFYTEVTFDQLLVKNHIGTTTQLLVRKNALEQVDGFDVRFPARQDYDLCLRLSKIGKAIGVNSYLFRHYLHGEEQISKSSKSSLDGYLLLLKKYRKALRNNRPALSNLLFKISRMCRLQNHIFQSAFYYFLGVSVSPHRWKEGLSELKSQKPV